MGANPGILIRLERERRLRYGFNALCDLETHLGIGLAALMLTGNIGVRTIRGLLWAGLKHEDGKLTPEQCGELVDVYVEQGGTFDKLLGDVKAAMAMAGWKGDGRALALHGEEEPADGRPFASGSPNLSAAPTAPSS
jgi:hypothetical protein